MDTLGSGRFRVVAYSIRRARRRWGARPSATVPQYVLKSRVRKPIRDPDRSQTKNANNLISLPLSISVCHICRDPPFGCACCSERSSSLGSGLLLLEFLGLPCHTQHFRWMRKFACTRQMPSARNTITLLRYSALSYRWTTSSAHTSGTPLPRQSECFIVLLRVSGKLRALFYVIEILASMHPADRAVPDDAEARG
jgi:hypothetical protein